MIADLDERPDGLRLVFEGKQIGFPAHASPEVRACFESDEPFRAADLPGELDAEGRLVLVAPSRPGGLSPDYGLTTRCAVTRCRRARLGSADSQVR